MFKTYLYTVNLRNILKECYSNAISKTVKIMQIVNFGAVSIAGIANA